MSENEVTIEQAIIGENIEGTINDGQAAELLSELRTLRAEAAAWRAVRDIYSTCPSNVVAEEVRDQIARLDAMKEGESHAEG